MTSGGNNFNYFPDNQLTKFSAVKSRGPRWKPCGPLRLRGRPRAPGWETL